MRHHYIINGLQIEGNYHAATAVRSYLFAKSLDTTSLSTTAHMLGSVSLHGLCTKCTVYNKKLHLGMLAQNSGTNGVVINSFDCV